MAQHSFTEFTAPFPACNHTEGFDKEYNHGYVQGATGDGVPFEAEHKPDEPIPYQRKEELVENSMLTIGMVRRERINNINVIIAYVDYFEQCGLYEFVTEYRNGALVQMTDINGNYLLQLNITIWSEDMGELVETYLDFKPFIDTKEKKAVKGDAKVLKFPGRN